TEQFERLMQKQREQSQAAQKKTIVQLSSEIESKSPTPFIGFDKLEATAKVLEIISIKDKTAVVLDSSAFYAEMGGQVGDTGELRSGGQLWHVSNTQKAGHAFVHLLAEKDAPAVGMEVQFSVDRC